MEVPLFYRDEPGGAKYELEFLADAEQNVSETNEANNSFRANWWTTSPNSFLRETPFVIEEAELVEV